ncbi:MAG TPA: U32 family peptidase [Candidatus Nanoarchaeia archaeon]|nr:U32 family peptidase [Candidatus Nanoarchaeia archaeon]
MAKKQKTKKKYELMAPAGDFPMLVAAVNAGADAVYFDLQEFTMRAAAKNFKVSDLERINKICGKKVKKYLTLNTIIYDNEIKRVEEIIKKIKGKADAVICWDPLIINLCRKYKVPFFISTQASVSNAEAAKFYKKLGAKRIVLARELNLRQIKKIIKEAGIELEAFAHGAMCVSISGRCFTSQFLFKKSANRGECLHPCRRTYTIRDEENNELKLENSRVMSAKDLCTLPFIDKMKKAGITSFKIEGRNRDPRYVDAVVRIYRKAIDKKLTKQEIKQGLKELDKVYNRGFSNGFYLGLPTADDFTNTENSAASESKHFVGKVTHYYPKVSVATIKLSSQIKVGDDIIIIGKTTGLEKSKIRYMEIEHNPIEEARKGQEIGLKLSKVRKNDEVYVIRKNIY